MAHFGGCLCGSVRYELDGEIGALINCHCQFCRRAHGAAFITNTLVPTSALRITSGTEDIARHEARYFCRRCGSRLYNRLESQPDATILMVASLDQPPSQTPVAHMNVESKAPWHEILDAAPQFATLPPGVEEALRRVSSPE